MSQFPVGEPDRCSVDGDQAITDMRNEDNAAQCDEHAHGTPTEHAIFLPHDILGHPHHTTVAPVAVFVGTLFENQPYSSTAPVYQNSSFTCTAIMRGLLSPPKPTPSKPVGGDVV